MHNLEGNLAVESSEVRSVLRCGHSADHSWFFQILPFPVHTSFLSVSFLIGHNIGVDPSHSKVSWDDIVKKFNLKLDAYLGIKPIKNPAINSRILQILTSQRWSGTKTRYGFANECNLTRKANPWLLKYVAGGYITLQSTRRFSFIRFLFSACYGQVKHLFFSCLMKRFIVPSIKRHSWTSNDHKATLVIVTNRHEI